MRAGRLNERVTIQQKSVLRETDGSEVITWVDIATVWMEVEPLAGREYLAARQAQSDVTTRFRCRFRAGLTTSQRLVWKGQPFNIKDVIELNARRTEIEIVGIAETVPT